MISKQRILNIHSIYTRPYSVLATEYAYSTSYTQKNTRNAKDLNFSNINNMVTTIVLSLDLL